MFNRYFVRYYIEGGQVAENIDRYLDKCIHGVHLYLAVLGIQIHLFLQLF